MFGMIPFERNNDNFFDIFDNFERKFFGNSSAALPDFRTDIRDAGDKFVLEAELPGFQKEDIKLDVKDGILTISAEHSESKDEKNEQGGYIRSGVDDEHITASYQNGVLELHLPKVIPAVPESKRIAIE